MTASDLHQLADTFGVARSWTGHGGKAVQVSDETLVTVLQALGALGIDESPDAALERHRDGVAHRRLPPTTVIRSGHDRATVRVPEQGRVDLVREDGERIPLPVIDGSTAVRIPESLQLGYHRLEVFSADAEDPIASGHLIVAPHQAPFPERGWGWMLQLYALRSAGSWGVGDLEDLRSLTRWSAAEGADFLVCNPLHAAAPTLPQEPSPYFPSSRRYWNPTYLRVETVPEYATAPEAVRRQVDDLADNRRADNRADRIDRDAAWEAKRTALELLWQAEHTSARREAVAGFRALEGEPLEQFALWCALAERHGPDWRRWPEDVRRPDGPGIADAYAEHADRIGFHAWLQFLVDEQLAATQAAAVADGMRLGIVHDLAVGVNPSGADGWALQDHLATGVTVGAPPDDFNQQGQDWAQPPLLPTRMAENGYAVVRDLVRRLLRSAGGIRIDHILGYFRLFWVPQDGGPAAGTYVGYPSEDLLGVLALEATRAGAVVIGEDLGVVAPGVREAMRERRLLGSRLLYFTYDDHGNRMPATGYETSALASTTTHDLPTAAGWWSDEGVRVQVELGLLGADTDPEEEYARKARDHASMEELLQADGLLPADTGPCTDADRVVAMHAFLARCGSVLVAANLPDAVGDLRQPNMPGTTDAYPNWRLPVATPGEDGSHVPVTLEDFLTHPQVRRVVDAIATGRKRGA